MDNIDINRRHKKNIINNDIKSTELTITRSEDTIQRLKNQKSDEFVINQISKLKILIDEKTEYLEKIRNDLIDIEAGEFDEEITKQYLEQQVKHEKREKEVEKSKNAKGIEKEKTQNISKSYMKNIIAQARTNRQYEKEMNYAQKYFFKVEEQLPDYMKRNLSDMPNNKGYIWRGVYFYGDLPEEQGPVIMFEKQKGTLLIIHEYNVTDYKRYEKNGKDRKILVHSEKRIPKYKETNLMDYVKKTK